MTSSLRPGSRRTRYERRPFADLSRGTNKRTNKQTNSIDQRREENKQRAARAKRGEKLVSRHVSKCTLVR